MGSSRRRSTWFRLVGPSALIASVLACLACSVSVGCGSATRGFDGKTYRDEKVGFGVPQIPVEWRRLEVSDASLAFRDDAHEATILLNGRCGSRNDDTPLLSLTQHLIIGTTERVVDSQDTIPFDSREALHTVMRAKLDGVVMSYDIYVLKKNGCVYDFVYVASPDHFAAGVQAFDRFVSGIHTVAVASE